MPDSSDNEGAARDLHSPHVAPSATSRGAWSPALPFYTELEVLVTHPYPLAPHSASPVTLTPAASPSTIFVRHRSFDDGTDHWIADEDHEDHERARDATCHLRNNIEPGSRGSFRMYQPPRSTSEHGGGEKAPFKTGGGGGFGVD